MTSLPGLACRAYDKKKLKTIANRAFPVVGPRTWNDLPDDVKSAESFIQLSSATENLFVH